MSFFSVRLDIYCNNQSHQMEPQTASLRLTAPVSARVSEPGPVGGPRVVFAPCSLQVLGVAEPQAALAEPSVAPAVAAFVGGAAVVVVVVVVVAAVAVVHDVVVVVLVQEVVGAVQGQLLVADVAVELPDVVAAAVAVAVVVVVAAAVADVVVVAHGEPQAQEGPGGAPGVAAPC